MKGNWSVWGGHGELPWGPRDTQAMGETCWCGRDLLRGRWTPGAARRSLHTVSDGSLGAGRGPGPALGLTHGSAALRWGLRPLALEALAVAP